MKDSILGKEVLRVIRENYDRIFSAEKKVADYVLNHSQDAVELNVSELARVSGVSDATVVRMCHHIGYAGYYQFRITLARDMGRKQRRAIANVEEKDAVNRVFAQYAELAVEVGKRIDEEVMWKCVNLLENADMVHVIAVGNACNISRYAEFRMERAGIRCVADSVPEYTINHINMAGDQDVVMAISKSGTSKAVIRGMELAREKGLKTIAVTASAQSPVASLADYLLVSSGKEEPFTIKKSNFYLNEFLVIEALLGFLIHGDKLKNVDVDIPEIVLADYKM